MTLCHLRWSTLFAASTVLLCLPSIFGQSTNPSNGSLPVDPNSPQLILDSKYDVDPLTDQAGASASVQQLQQIKLTGELVLTTSINVQSLQQGQFAYISCNPSDYQGFANAQGTIQYAIPKIQGQNGNQGAIILYSTNSIYCTYAPGPYVYPFVYTMTDANDSKALLDTLSAPGPPSPQSTIILDPNSVNNTNSAQNALGPSPTTAVAMIILYSITGIITTLFLVIIVTGAVRAHRHPERYGPRNIMGRPRQTRAKGIARAMLEGIPIVKFGETEKDEPKTIHNEGDIELGQAVRHDTIITAFSDAETGPAEAGHRDASEANPGPDVVRTEAAEGIAPPQDRVEGSRDNNAENGLACSVCTDDFIKGQDIRVLPCNHKYHPECIDPWLLNVSGTCPMCRVDLRPTADRTVHADDGHEPSGNPYLTAGPETTDAINGAEPWTAAGHSTGNSEGGIGAGRRSNGLSLYVRHTLNLRRMRDATPEERLDALRRIRIINRASNGDGERGDRRSRVGSRLSRLWAPQQAGPSDATGSEEIREG